MTKSTFELIFPGGIHIRAEDRLEHYQKQGDTRAAEWVQSAVQQLALIMPINGLQAASLPFPGIVPFDEFTSCGACGHRYKKSLIDCPQCGSRNCPNCQQLCQDTDEFCPACDTYLGPRSLRYFGGQ